MSQRPPVKNLDALSDVVIASPTDQQSLVYQSATSDWRNSAVPNSALATLTDVTLNTPVDGQLLRYDGTSGKWIDYGPLAFSDLDPTSNIAVTQINNGTGASSTTFHRGDGTWSSAISADPGSAGNVMTSDGVNWVSAPLSSAPTKITISGTSGTFTVTTGCKALQVECWGGGGQGGGAPTCSAQASCGAGGGAGAYSITYILSPASSYAYTIGAAGTGAAAGAVGTAGGDTVFGSICTAKGGGGGNMLAAGTGISQQGGGAGGVGASGVGDVKVNGAYGGVAVRWSATQAMSGYGGASSWGGGSDARQAFTGGVAGVAAVVFSAGGSGAATTSTAATGGAGLQGLIKVTEFF